MSDRAALPFRAVLETDAGRLASIAAVTALLLILSQNGPNSQSGSTPSPPQQPPVAQAPQSQLNWGTNSSGVTQANPSNGPGVLRQLFLVAARSMLSSNNTQSTRIGMGSRQFVTPKSCSGIEGRLVPRLGHRLDPPQTPCSDISGSYSAIQQQRHIVGSHRNGAQTPASTSASPSVPIGSKDKTFAPLPHPNSVSQGLEGIWTGTATVGRAKYHYEWELVSEVGSRISGLVHVSPDRGAPRSTYRFVGTIDGEELSWTGTEWVNRQFRRLCIASGKLKISETMLVGIWHGGGTAPGACPASSNGEVELFKHDPSQSQPIQPEMLKTIKKAL